METPEQHSSESEIIPQVAPEQLESEEKDPWATARKNAQEDNEDGDANPWTGKR